MGLYLYKHPEEDLYIEVFQKMKDEHVFFDQDGLEWKRVYTVPNVAFDSRPIDPYSSKEFVKATNKKGTVGDMLDLSAELSNKRADKEGEDPVKRKFFDKYQKENKVKHLADRKDVIETNRYKIDFTKKENTLKFKE